MSDLGDMIRDRLARMPLTVWLCTMAGVVLGVGAGFLLLSNAGVAANARAIIGGMACVGFILGIVAGSIIQTVFRRSDDTNDRKRQRRPPGA